MSPLAPTAADELTLADWTQTIKQSALQELLRVASQPGILSLALGLPAPELFPAADYARAVERVLAHDPVALQYGPPFRPLKSHIVGLMARRGVACREEQVFLTAGAQQGVSLLARLLLNPGGQVLFEETIYSGFQQAVEPFQPEVLTVPTDPESGMDVEAVESLLRGGARPAFIYAISNGHNPLSVNMSAEKRARLVELAEEYRVPVVEDDPYGFLFYEQTPAPLRALSEEWVFYVGSFSKILAPSLRVGWVILPESLVYKIAALKEGSDIDTSTFAQRSISAYLDAGHLDAHLAGLRRAYGERRDAMVRALAEHFPAEARWRVPASGVFVWVELPRGADTGELLRVSVERERVAFIPGHAFGVMGSRRAANCLRLNFSNSDPRRIEDGVARLGRVLAAM
jgi:2-aminoadipate transaminase